MIAFRSLGSELEQPRTSQHLEDDAEKNADVKVLAARVDAQGAFTLGAGGRCRGCDGFQKAAPQYRLIRPPM
jgi:hypothetical protein